MIDIFEIEILKDNEKKLKCTSKDHANDQYMTESLRMVVNFDGVKEQYIKINNLSQISIKSVDALMQFKKDKPIIFVEFKNGIIFMEENPKNGNSTKKIILDPEIEQEICDKAQDSLLVFNDIVGKNISYTRKNVDFILVYNYEKNSQRLKNSIRVKSMRFKFYKFKNIYFRNVTVCTKESFKKFLEKNNFI